VQQQSAPEPVLRTILDDQGRAIHTREPAPQRSNPFAGIVDAITQGFTAPGRAARGEPVTFGDVVATAGDYGMLGAPMRAPAGALRAGAMRSADDGFSDYLARVNPSGQRIAADDRPNLGMGDMYGMLPRNSRPVGERNGVQFFRSGDDFYATAYNPDVGEMDVVGYAMGRGDGTELQVVHEMQRQGIGGELQYLYRSANPYSPTGGLTEAGEGSLRGTFRRLVDDGIISPNAAQASMPETPAQMVARMLSGGRASEVTDDMMARVDPMEMFDLYEGGATGMPMPMDEASRMARAGEMGFDTGTPLYHGTGADIQSFRPAPGAIGEGSYFGRNLEDGVGYISEFGAPDQSAGARLASRYANVRSGGDRATAMEGANVISAFGPDNVAYVSGGLGGLPDAAAFDRMPGLVRAIPDPRNIRSRFARFDPRLSHLANLSAGAAGGAVTLQQLMSDPNADERALREYLQALQ
jgi:hypothetical protein